MRVKGHEDTAASSVLAFSPIWDILGPFQIGTREATWGADPLENYGGFSQLHPNDKSYPSSLGWQGKVDWGKLTAQTIFSGFPEDVSDRERRASAAVYLNTRFPEIDWKTQQEFYGWPALQWQAWIRGTLTVSGSESTTVKIYTPAILEFEIDGQRYFGGDFFSYMEAPLILHLQPGAHIVNVRVIRDVRASGGIGEPIVELKIYAVPTAADGLDLARSKAIIPDFVKGFGFSSTICCITAHNTGSRWLDVVSVNANNVDRNREYILVDGPVSIAPGQTKAISVGIKVSDPLDSEPALLSFSYVWRGLRETIETDPFLSQPMEREPSEPHKVVFRRPNGTISYALVQAPSPATINEGSRSNAVPVLAVLHGAGVEAESTQSRNMLQEMGDIPAWVIVPTGSTRWSGDDWHTWGLADVEAAIAAIPKYIYDIHPERPKADIQSIYIAGHSNGGQGIWHMLTHLSDRICAAAAVSGYLSIQKYVPYSMWNEVDPKISGLLHGSLSSYRHELLVENTKGIPILQQHGDKDDNVPTFHSRRMYQLLQETGSDPDYHELPGKSHWDNGTMATPALKSFYRQIGQHVNMNDRTIKSFSIVLPSTGELIGSRGGIVVDQLRLLGQLGRMDVECRSKHIWNIKTSNIAQFHLGSKDYRGPYPQRIRLDDTMFELGHVSFGDSVGFLFESDCRWTRTPNAGWKSLTKRSGLQFGTINAILRTRSQLQIRSQPESAFPIALQISRNLYQYYLASCDLLPSGQASETDSNEIFITIGSPHTAGNKKMLPELPDYPIRVVDHGIVIQTSKSKRVYPHSPGLGAIYLVPRTEERLLLVIWGYDFKGAQQAARLVPMLTGVGQPDFVVVRDECSWRGAGGVLAMGFLESDWTISEAAYLS